MVCRDVSDGPSKTPSELEIGRDYSTGVSQPEPSAGLIALAARVEALLFVAPAEVGLTQLASALEVTAREIELALEWLDGAYKQRGMQIQRSNRSVQLTTAPSMAADIERFLELEETSRLSRAALEVLAIIAYQQPVTRPQIDSIRGCKLRQRSKDPAAPWIGGGSWPDRSSRAAYLVLVDDGILIPFRPGLA